MTTCTKTIVFTDLSGYTQFTAKMSGEELQAFTAKHENHTLETFKPFGGELIKSIGDSYMAVFNSATEAVKACLQLVSSSLPNTDMMFRASVVTGDVQEVANDYFRNKDFFGEAVNLSSRICAITPAGEVWFSNRTRICMNQSEIAWESVGIHVFKGIAEKEECFRAVPENQCIFESELETAILNGKYIVHQKGDDLPLLMEELIILVDFELESEDLKHVLRKMGAISSGNIWLLSYMMPTASKLKWLKDGYRFIISTMPAFWTELDRLKNVTEEDDISQTGILIDLHSIGEISLGLVGIALPSVPLVDLIEGYSIDLLMDGTWGYNSKAAVLQIKVNSQNLTLLPLKPGILINSIGVVPGQPIDISNGGTLRYRDWSFQILCNIGGLYRALISGSASGEVLYNVGDLIEVGRQPAGKRFLLTDRGGTNRIHWAPTPKANEAKKQKLTLDRTLTGRQHSHIQIMSNDTFVASSIHPRLPTFVIRKDGKRLERVKKDSSVQLGDMIVVGTYVLSLARTF